MSGSLLSPVPASLPDGGTAAHVHRWHSSAIGCAALVAAVLLSAPRLLRGPSWERLMRVQTTLPEPVAEAIRQAVGREAARLKSYTTRGGVTMHRMQLVIYRLEEVELTERIHRSDPDAIVDVIPLEGSGGWGSIGKWPKRHNRPDLPDVSKYGNEL
ncbi:hypothetical protein SK3146_01339 [Paenibacillus konkukensis]|uniref:Uncharacterized protein n=1 Tax=Paenibacillus konkukensis TaxID=2020716 RepID=A0ABY4RIG1_9BACL|nr:hypothetical protein [Paenibacillus konkukensis]UQZ82182.1 hypothetical protein SK3146_01339 [Paenibacillus konkukensis]